MQSKATFQTRSFHILAGLLCSVALLPSTGLLAQLRLNVEGSARVTGSLIELVKPSDPGHTLNLSSDGAAMDINATTDLYLNSANNINLNANNPTGRIGIGTAGPLAKLHVIGDRLRLATPGNENRYIDLRTDGASLDINPVGADLFIDPGENNLLLATQSGYVGIGTGSPESKLSVAGDTRMEGRLDILREPGDSSIFIGLEAGQADDGTDNQNVFIGTLAGRVNNTGFSNTFIGSKAGYDNTNGYSNTFMGNRSGYRNTSGQHNTFVGSSAGSNNLTGSRNTYLGLAAGASNQTGWSNVIIGTWAGFFNLSGSYNTFLGSESGYNNEGAYNTFVGYRSGTENETGHSNTFVGYQAGEANLVGTRSTFIGYQANDYVPFGDSLDRAISIGFRANVACSHCAVIGGRGVDSVKVGIGTNRPTDHLDIRNDYGNAGIRVNAEDGGTSHLRLFEHFSGYGFEFQYDGGPDKLHLWSREFANNEAIRMTWLKNGDVGIGTTDPAKRLDVIGEAIFRDENKLTTFHSTGANAFFSFENNGGTLGADVGYFNDTSDEYFFINTPGGDFGELIINGSNVGIGLLNPAYQLQLSTNSAAKPSSSTWTVASDKRLKKNIRPFTDGLNVLQQIEPIWYQYNGKAGLSTEERSIGIIAQDMQRIAPYTVGSFGSNKEQFLSFDANALFYITINAVKEQQQVIDRQENELKELRSEVESLKQLVGKLVDRDIATENEATYVLPLETKATLFQNHPNPFHQQTIIRYFIPGTVRHAFLRVMEADGTELARVNIDQKGTGQVVIKANTYPAGTYFYTLVLDGEAMPARKMILSR